MATNENSFLEDVRKSFTERHMLGYWRKNHGDQHQAGMPDVLCGIEDVCALVEFKWVTSEKEAMLTVPQMIVSKLTDLQRVELMRLAALNGPLRARVVVGFPFEADELPAGVGELAVGVDFGEMKNIKESLAELAGIALTARYTAEWKAYSPGVQLQLRCRGEKWRAAQLCLGMQRWQVRTKFDPEQTYD